MCSELVKSGEFWRKFVCEVGELNEKNNDGRRQGGCCGCRNEGR